MSLERPTLVLHLGMGKTGTTALQHFLWANRERLLSHGIDYPDVGIRDAAHHLLCPDPPHYLASRPGWNFMPPAEVAAALAMSESPTIVVSSELLFTSTAGAMRGFINPLSEHFDVQAVAYLRPQHDVIYSRYNQRVKSGLEQRRFARALPTIVDNLDYARKLEPVRGLVGSENLTVKPYEPGSLVGGDIRKDFVQSVLGVDSSEPLEFPAESLNPGFPDRLLEYKRLLNHVITDRDEHKLSNSLLLQFHLAQAESQKEVAIRHPIPTRYLRRLEEANRRLAQEYGASEEFFFQNSATASSVVEGGRTRRPLSEREISDFLLEEDEDFVELLHCRIREALSQGNYQQRRAARRLRRSFSPPWYQSLPFFNENE